MRVFNRLRKLLLSGTQFAPVPARDEKGNYGVRAEASGNTAANHNRSPRNSVSLWLGINVVIAVSLLGFISNVGGDTWEARLVAAVSAVLLGLSAIIAVLFAIVERSARQRRERPEE